MSAARPLKFKLSVVAPHRSWDHWYATQMGALEARSRQRKLGYTAEVTEYILVPVGERSPIGPITPEENAEWEARHGARFPGVYGAPVH